MKQYDFYGWQQADMSPVNPAYSSIKDPRMLYDILWNLWCERTCAPRLRSSWSPENRTLGQCSITSFLAQDIFGGDVYGILRPAGNYHCYNVVGGHAFDLTSQQFGQEKLDYSRGVIQSRQDHFSKQEKYDRYLYLKSLLDEAAGQDRAGL